LGVGGRGDGWGEEGGDQEGKRGGADEAHGTPFLGGLPG
jgi:hypothetical protein